MEREGEGEIARLREALRTLAGTDFYGKGKRKGEDGKGLSSPKVAAYFYDTLKCKPYYNRKTRTRTADEEAIRRLMRAYKKARPVGALILELRMWQKRGDFLAAKRIDEDGRFRAMYVPTAVTGRLQSSENPLGTGSNGQNIPRPPSPVRGIFIPDKGHILLEWDLSRAEDRIVGGMSGNAAMMREALAGVEVDTYMDVAESLEIAKALEPLGLVHFTRPTGKRVKLAAGYGMRGDTMSKAALLETEGALNLDPRQCDAWLDRLYALRPGIPAYQAWIREQLLSQGFLENSWGRRWYVRKLRLGDDDYRDGYAWMAQSEVGVLMNQWGFRFADRLFRREKLPAAVVQQGHDAIVTSVDPAVAWDVMVAVADNLGRPRDYGGVKPWTLAMPVGYKIGPRWGSDMSEWKTRPTRAAFEEEVERCVQQAWWTTTNRRSVTFGSGLRKSSGRS